MDLKLWAVLSHLLFKPGSAMDVKNIMQLTTGIAVIKTINFDMNNFLSMLTIALKKPKNQNVITEYSHNINGRFFINNRP
jgi:hypothetical protein